MKVRASPPVGVEPKMREESSRGGSWRGGATSAAARRSRFASSGRSGAATTTSSIRSASPFRSVTRASTQNCAIAPSYWPRDCAASQTRSPGGGGGFFFSGPAPASGFSGTVGGVFTPRCAAASLRMSGYTTWLRVRSRGSSRALEAGVFEAGSSRSENGACGLAGARCGSDDVGEPDGVPPWTLK